VEPLLAGIVGLAPVVMLAVGAQVGRSTPAAPGPRPSPWLPWSLVAVFLLPLLLVPEGLASRHTYLLTFPLAWAGARALSASRNSRERHAPPLMAGLLVLGLVVGSVWQLALRGRQISHYREKLQAARIAVFSGLARGGRLFHLVLGIKDLDLAIKADPALAVRRHDFWVLNDVPASFVYAPPARLRPLLASPALPPSGAYVFGTERVVGLARRGDEPTLDEAFVLWPDLRLLRPCSPAPPAGAFALCDVTEAARPR